MSSNISRLTGANSNNLTTPRPLSGTNSETYLDWATLEHTIPFRIFATIAYKVRVSRERLANDFMQWIRHISSMSRLQVGWLRAYEQAIGTTELHIHAAIVAPRPLEVPLVEDAWHQVAEPRHKSDAQIEPYIPGHGGLGYIMKDREGLSDVSFSNNIALFGERPPDNCNSGQLRTFRRIQEQMIR
jgi:hypothetical protein